MVKLSIPEVIGIIIAIILILIIVFLYLGVKINLTYNKLNSDFEYHLNITLLNSYSIFRKDHPLPKECESDGEKESDRDGEGYPFKEIIKPLLDVLDSLVEYLTEILHSLEIKKLENHLDFGMSSYVSTAKYTGYMWSLFVVPNSSHKNVKLTVEPTFKEPTFDFKGCVDIKVNLLKIVIPTIQLLRQKEVRDFIKLVRNPREGKDNGENQEPSE